MMSGRYRAGVVNSLKLIFESLAVLEEKFQMKQKLNNIKKKEKKFLILKGELLVYFDFTLH